MARARAELTELVSAASAVIQNSGKEGARIQAAVSAVTSPSSSLAAALARPRVGVGVVLRSTCGCAAHMGRILVGARRGSHGAGRWALPGGHLEHGEAWADTAARELEEETGIHVLPGRFSMLLVTNDIMSSEGLHYITIFMAADISHEEALAARNCEPDKCDGWEWLNRAELSSRPLFLALENALRDGLGIYLPT